MKDIDERVRAIENQIAFLKGAAIVGAVLITAYFGLTAFYFLPKAASDAAIDRVGDNTIEQIERAKNLAGSFLDDTQSLLQCSFKSGACSGNQLTFGSIGRGDNVTCTTSEGRPTDTNKCSLCCDAP